MNGKTRVGFGALTCAVLLVGSLLVAPSSSAAVNCLRYLNTSVPAKALWSQEDRYTNSAGEIWIQYQGRNYCGRTIQGWTFRLELVDAFGDTFYTGTGKVYLKKPVRAGKKFKANKNGGYGVFNLYGSTWKNFKDWKRQRADRPSGPATWRYTVLKTI